MYPALNRALILIGVWTLASACAQRPAADDASRPSRPARRSNSLITRDELTASSARDAFQAVQMLRPDWLRGRGASSLSGGVAEVVIYVDGQRVGPQSMLAQFGIVDIKELRFYSATDATQRWGTGHSGGVIEIATR